MENTPHLESLGKPAEMFCVNPTWPEYGFIIVECVAGPAAEFCSLTVQHSVSQHALLTGNSNMTHNFPTVL